MELAKDEAVADHFEKVSQVDMEKYAHTYENGNYEGPTMFKFIDRDEWCVMIDNYGDMSIRYEPYLTTDLSEPDSIQKAAKGTYGRTGGDVGTHGGMIPITVKEYNTMIDTYNADFMNYIGDRVKGTNVRTLANVVKNHNLAVIKTDPAAAPGTNNRIVTFNGAHEATAIDTAGNGIKSGKMYNVTVTYNSEGLIDSVTATEL